MKTSIQADYAELQRGLQRIAALQADIEGLHTQRLNNQDGFSTPLLREKLDDKYRALEREKIELYPLLLEDHKRLEAQVSFFWKNVIQPLLWIAHRAHYELSMSHARVRASDLRDYYKQAMEGVKLRPIGKLDLLKILQELDDHDVGG